MPVPAASNTRAGGATILNLARTLCRIVNIAAPTVRIRWANRPAFLAVLEAAVGMCELLPAADAEQAEMDAFTGTFDPSDGTKIPGQIV